MNEDEKEGVFLKRKFSCCHLLKYAEILQDAICYETQPFPSKDRKQPLAATTSTLLFLYKRTKMAKKYLTKLPEISLAIYPEPTLFSGYYTVG
ncbi:MAG: hypothetical protein AB7E77_07360 [Desulfobulbus sp.]